MNKFYLGPVMILIFCLGLTWNYEKFSYHPIQLPNPPIVLAPKVAVAASASPASLQSLLDTPVFDPLRGQQVPKDETQPLPTTQPSAGKILLRGIIIVGSQRAAVLFVQNPANTKISEIVCLIGQDVAQTGYKVKEILNQKVILTSSRLPVLTLEIDFASKESVQRAKQLDNPSESTPLSSIPLTPNGNSTP